MSQNRKSSSKGFSLVELLAVVLVLAALAAVAIPLYTSQRKSAAGRTCKANLAAISASLSAFALRFNKYPADLATVSSAYVADGSGGLIGAPEGLASWPACPLGQAYTYTVAGGAATIACPNDAAAAANSHNGYGGVTGNWTITLAAPAADSLP